MRPEEVAAARWQALMKPTVDGDWMLAIEDTLSHGRIAGVKTVERSKRVPTVVHQWLAAWREVAASHGLAVDDRDFTVPGTAHDGHFSLNQHKKWGSKYFRPAAETVAREYPKLAHVAGATPYSARRGHITCRILAGEPVERRGRPRRRRTGRERIATRSTVRGQLLRPMVARPEPA
jgi:hypothetical protein